MFIPRQNTNNGTARLSKAVVSCSHNGSAYSENIRRLKVDSHLESSSNPMRWCALDNDTQHGNTVC